MSDRELRRPPAGAPGEPMPEGTEAPPAGTRAMATVRWALIALMALLAAGAWAHLAGLAPRGAASRTEAQYRCPMHPAVLLDRAGQCPICGMDLVPADGKAPSNATETEIAARGKYWCPMHAEVTSDDPEARCDRCGGMKLVLRSAPAADAGVPGLAPVEIDAARTQLMGMRTAKVTRERLAGQLRTVGFVSADEKRLALVTARFSGWIEELLVARSGERVERGQILATVSSQELATAQQVYLNSVKWADRQGPGTGAAAQGGVGVESDARRRLELLGVAPQDVAEIARTGQPMLAVPVRSPVAGYVARKAALPGLYVQPGTELFQIADLSRVWVIADVYERDVERVAVGQRARLTLAAHRGQAFGGRVQFIYPALNPESRTVQARMEFKNPDLRLKPGMYGDVELELAAGEALTVPVEAVVDTGDQQYVFLARPGGRFEPRRVRLGEHGDGRVQVLDGLAEGDAVVTTANFLVDSESRLRSAVEGFRSLPAQDGRGEHQDGDQREPPRADARN